MFNVRSTAKSLFALGMMGILFGGYCPVAHADSTTSSSSSGSFIDPNTNMRTIRQAPGQDPTTGAPTAAYPGNPGCSQNVMSSMSNVANYHYGQNVAVHVNTMQQPSSFSSCITNLIKQANTLNNLFSSGFGFDAIVNVAFKSASDGLLSSLEQQACQDVEKAAHGLIGTPSKNYGLLSVGGVTLSVNPAQMVLVCPSGYSMITDTYYNLGQQCCYGGQTVSYSGGVTCAGGEFPPANGSQVLP